MKKSVLPLPSFLPALGASGANSSPFKLNSHNAVYKNILYKSAFVCALFIFLSTISITKLLAQPTIEWEKLIKGIDQEVFVDLKQTADGGYILGGTSISEAGLDKSEGTVGGTRSTDYWVVKLNAAGEKQWDNTLGGNDWDDLTALDVTADGGYILAGISSSNASGDKSENVIGTERNTWIIKLNAAGVKEWDKTIVGNFSFIEQTPDGGYILSGDGRVLKLNANRSIAWDKTINGALEQTTDGGFILIYRALAVKLDAAGNKIWEQPLAGISNVPAGFGLVSVQQTADGGYIMGGRAEDYYVIKLDAAGNKEWDKILGGPSSDWLKTVIQTADGGYLVGGDSHSGAGGDKSETNKGPLYDNINYYYRDFWVVKLDAAGNRVWDKTIGGIFHDDLRTLEQTADGGFILGGMYDGRGYWAVKLAGEITSPPNNLCNLALTSKVIQAEPWYGMYPGGGGGIDLTVTGGTPPYRYTWNNFRNSPEDAPAPAVAPGVYTVVVTDARGCTARGTVEVGKKNDPMRLHTSSLNVTTAGDPTGSIDLSVVGGGGSFKYRWSNGATTEDLTGLAVGTYTVTVTDAFGRKATTSVTITNPRTPIPTVCDIALTSKLTQAEPWYGMWGPTNGAGAIDLTVSGGTAPYTYRWNNGVTNQDIAVAAPGVYTVTVTDAKACTATTTVTVSRKNGPFSLTASHINVSAAGRQDGSIDLSVLGGGGSFKYRWSNGATTEDLTGLAAGTYTVVVTDAFGRTATISVQILAPGTQSLVATKTPGATEKFLAKESGLTIYPNPANNQATVNFSLPTAGKYTLQMYDIRGAKVKTIAAGQAAAANNLELAVNLSGYAEGVYLLKLVTDKGVKTERVVVQR